jgi:hypothetical protein
MSVRGKSKEVTCKCCGTPFRARIADIKRGWGKYCSKSCKAIKQTQRTGYYGPNRDENRGMNKDGSFQMSQADLAAGGYGDADWNTSFGDGKM